MATPAENLDTSSNKPVTSLKFGYYVDLALATDISDFKERIKRVIVQLGFSDFIYMQLETKTTPQQQLFNTLPNELILSYYNAGYCKHDMNIQRAKDNRKLFFHSTIHDYVSNAPFTSEMTHYMYKIRELNKSFGYYDFCNIPIHPQKNRPRAVLMVTHQNMKSIDLQRTTATCESTLRLLSEAIDTIARQKFADYFIDKNACKRHNITITPKPLRVLNTLANNDYSISEIAEKLCISVVTVNQHLKTVRNCFEAKTNYAAIKQAIQAKLIVFSSQPNAIEEINET